MSQNVCPQCGSPLPGGANYCTKCGVRIVYLAEEAQAAEKQAVEAQTPEASASVSQAKNDNQPAPVPRTGAVIDPGWPVKNKIAAGLLGIFLGGLGIHKFYMGRIGMGILYLCFFWTGIPAVIGFIEGIVYLCSNDENFQVKHHVRLE